MKGFWKQLPKPFFVLAPMADVTDMAFRHIIIRCGKPDVLFTPFVSCDGLCSAGRDALMDELQYDMSERPIVAQLFGSNPDNFFQAAAVVQKLGFDGIDINMGCPHKNVVKQGAGAALITKPVQAQKIIRAAKQGADKLPISVKTRVGDTKNILSTWLPLLLNEGVSAITIHARTRKEMSNVPAHWDSITEAVTIAKGYETLIIGNGDVLSIDHAKKLAEETGVHGIMLGRAIFGNPWLFSQSIPSVQEKLTMLCEHAFLFEKFFCKRKKFSVMKKHCKAYASGFRGAKTLRMRLMESNNAREVARIVHDYL